MTGQRERIHGCKRMDMKGIVSFGLGNRKYTDIHTQILFSYLYQGICKIVTFRFCLHRNYFSSWSLKLVVTGHCTRNTLTTGSLFNQLSKPFICKKLDGWIQQLCMCLKHIPADVTDLFSTHVNQTSCQYLPKTVTN